MRIFLIGFMGCGKTTLREKLAKTLNYNFVFLIEMLMMRMVDEPGNPLK